VTVEGGNITSTSVPSQHEGILENNLSQAMLNYLEDSTIHF